MRRYAKYKDSGVKWIGDIPEGWGMSKINLYFKIERGRVISKEEIIDNIGEYPVFSSQTENFGILGLIKTFDFEGEYVSWTTDGANAGTCFHRNGKFSTTNVCGLLSNKTQTNNNLKFLTLFLNLGTKAYVRLDINPKLMNNMMGNIPFILPPLKEQEQIVAFLDEKTSHIDNLLDISKRKIGLLKEQRASIINQVITKGLNPNAKMKHSGVEWIGDIPEGWGVNKMKYGVKLITEKALTNLNDVKISPENVEPMTGNCFNYYSTYLGEGIKFRKGDVLLNKLRIYLKKIVLVSMDGYSMGEMLVLRCNEKFFNEYFYYQIFHQGLIDLLNSQSNGVKLPRVSSDIILNTLVAFPPLDEQEQIVAYLDEKTSTIDKSISIEERRIGLLKEYRQSIISQVITGKIKVIADE
jgi:type I restriction enzyme S subunit